MEGLDGWRVEENELRKQFEFGAYLDGLEFVTALGREAEMRDHHPDMTITWRKVAVSLSTHSEGGITSKDVDLAKFADQL